MLDATWREACAGFAAEQALETDVLPLLAAFGRETDDPRRGWDFAALEAAAGSDRQPLAAEIVSVLSQEIDHDQALLFARRFVSVAGLLDHLAAERPAGRILRVGLWQRLWDVLAAAPPRALRVRAVGDFYCSQAAVVTHRRSAGPSLADRVNALAWTAVAPGVAKACLAGPTRSGPVHINLLSVAPGCTISAWDNRGESLVEETHRRGLVAATSGGFFLYSEADIAPPSARHDLVGLLVSEGVVVSPPVLARTALVVGSDGERNIDRIGPDDALVHLRDGRVLAPQTPGSRAPVGSGRTGRRLPVLAFNRAWGETTPGGAGTAVVVVGQEVVAVAAGSVGVPLNGLVLQLPPGEPPPVPGPVSWSLRRALASAMAGGPRLLRDGVVDLDRQKDDFAGSAPPVTFSQDETFDQNLLPRLVAGLRLDGTLILAAVDGRNLHRAPGMTLRGSAGLLARLGCTEAMNLDGGSSKRMVVQGQTVDLATTEVVAQGSPRARMRPVHSALGCAALRSEADG